MGKIKHKFTEQQDNLICTFVKLYHFNISFGVKRASEFLGIKYSLVLARYYKKLRNSKKVFVFTFGDKEVWNTKRINYTDLEKLRQFEPKIGTTEAFPELEHRIWWGD